MFLQTVDVVNKAPSFHGLDALKFALESNPVIVGLSLFCSLIICVMSIISLYRVHRHKIDNNTWKTILFSISLPIISICFLFFYVNETLPSPIFSKGKESHVFEPYPYVIKSDTKSMNKIKNSQTTLYYDKQYHVLNEFPDKLSKEEQLEASLNNKKIETLKLNTSKEQALHDLIDSQVIKRMDKILSVSEHNGQTIIEYTN